MFWSIQFTTSLTFNIINTTEAEAKLSSVERVLEYADLPPEDAKSWLERMIVAMKKVTPPLRTALWNLKMLFLSTDQN